MGLFTANEIDYLRRQHLGRLATSGKTGMPHVVPTAFFLDIERETIKIGGHTHNTKNRLYIRHLGVNPNAAFVVDDLELEPAYLPHGVTVKGPVQIHDTGGDALGEGFAPQWIEITPHWVNSWGIDADPFAPTSKPRKLTDADS